MRACIYTRISRDADQEGLGVQRQEVDCRALVQRNGWTLVEPPYVDNDISASTRSQKPRPQYDRMIAAVRGGQIDVIVAYSNSRLTRRMRELLDLIDLHDKTGVTIHTVVSGNDDLSTADGRMVAQIKASVDAAEAERTSERLRRAFLAKSQKGAVNQGRRAFGWDDDKVHLHPKEARLLRAAIQDIIDGVAVREVSRRWNAAGVTTTAGNEWGHTAVREVLRNVRLAGWRTHQGKPARDASGQPVKGVWTPMISQSVFDALQGALDGRQPNTRRGAQKYLLSGVTRCSVCGLRMHGYRTKTGHAYSCCVEHADHTVTIAGKQTDDLLSLLVAQKLATVDLSATPVKPAEWEGAARLRQVAAKITELMSAFNAGVLTGAIVFPQVQALESEQARLQHERPTSAPRLLKASAEAFPALDLDRQRAVIESLLDAVVVAPASRRGQPWTPERLSVVWHD